jgi:hypothetical protein
MPKPRRPALATPAEIAAELRSFSIHQRRVALAGAAVAFLVMGVVGETLPIASIGREVPVEWWNYVTLVLSPLLIGLIVATFVDEGAASADAQGTKTGLGIGGTTGTVAMACPACSPLAIPLFGTAGVLSFLAPDRGLISLLSIILPAITLALRIGSSRACRLPST